MRHTFILIVLIVLVLTTGISVLNAQGEIVTNTPAEAVEAAFPVDVTEEVTAAPEPPVDEAPVEPAPTDPGVNYLREFMPYLTQIIIALFIGVVLVAGTAIVVAGQGMPKWARDVLKGTVDSGFKQAEFIVADTPTTIDDELLADLKRRVDELFRQMDKLPAAVAKAMNEGSGPGLVG